MADDTKKSFSVWMKDSKVFYVKGTHITTSNNPPCVLVMDDDDRIVAILSLANLNTVSDNAVSGLTP